MPRKMHWGYYVAGGAASFLVIRPLLVPGRIVSVAEGEVGNAYQDKYGAATNWCAVFAGWVVERAARSLGYGTPSWRYENGKPVAGAKRLVVRAAEAGQWIAKDGRLLATPRAGDLMSLDRGAEGSWQGHVVIITRYNDGVVEHISGNAGGSPSRVKKGRGTLADMRLEAIARPDIANTGLSKLALTGAISYGAYRLLR